MNESNNHNKIELLYSTWKSGNCQFSLHIKYECFWMKAIVLFVCWLWIHHPYFRHSNPLINHFAIHRIHIFVTFVGYQINIIYTMCQSLSLCMLYANEYYILKNAFESQNYQNYSFLSTQNFPQNFIVDSHNFSYK